MTQPSEKKVMSALEHTLDQYHELMRINAVSHLVRTARRVGILKELGHGQRTAEQLCEALSLASELAGLILEALVSIGIIEKYADDYALSQAARLLCQYDDDLGDCLWERLVERTVGTEQRDGQDDQQYFDYTAATQWIHTPAAMQAAEVLNIGGDGEFSGPSILDIGCGSAVWSCAMAHRDPAAKLTIVDQSGAIEAASITAESIGVSERVTAIVGEPGETPLSEGEYDIVLLAQRLHSVSIEASDALLGRAVTAAKPGGRIVVIDLFRGPNPPDLSQSIEALRLDLETTAGSIRTPQQLEVQMQRYQLQRIEFTFLTASGINLGMVVAVKPE